MTPKKFFNLLVIIVVVLSFLGFGISFYLWTYLKKISQENYQKEVVLGRFTEKVYALENLKRNFQKIKPLSQDILLAFPKEKDSEEVLRFLEENAVTNSVSLEVYRYEEPNDKKKVETPSDLVLIQTRKKDGDYYELTLLFTAEGPYKDVLSFFKNVEASKRLMTVKNVDITKIEGASKDTIKLTSSISVYLKP